ncbi:hypothetical protein AHiyo1_06770 [Arthrobacter sp. Hiyo1]|nr:hypothetical protein AHiyo1_06770 [Arthrobacter sp. Hiyo1]
MSGFFRPELSLPVSLCRVYSEKAAGVAERARAEVEWGCGSFERFATVNPPARTARIAMAP